MTIINIRDGLGNQMFQYAFAKVLESKGESVVLDTSWYSEEPDSVSKNIANKKNIRNLEITRFDIKIVPYMEIETMLQTQDKFYHFFSFIHKLIAYAPKECLRVGLKSFLPKTRRFHPYKYHIKEVYDSRDLSALPHDILKNALIFGFFQKLSYFKHIDSEIRADFTLCTPLSPANEAMKKRILSTPNAAFIHIRRGDYLNVWQVIKLGKAYYASAIKEILTHVKNPKFFIFSNDIEWCKNNFINLIDSSVFAGKEYEFVEQNGEGDAIEELELMRSCKHGIIANSTFSWWAAYLMENPKKTVIAPSKFFLIPPPQEPNHIDDILPEGWIKTDPTWGNVES
ncbi:hypothetical protein BKN38_05455 [Helicobacter sp. CLO-3]|uniref:alpha-1,2-fucosyltransferase n=1 Tax=unclassified Helicobacter TaxID=2593540 RepID=UPI000805F9F0|nr:MULTISPECIES: alpha-1,2-fucosyltransferase [unclassified Helicobacter]OBV29045.1 hypothetical protein BA723_07130 [Helicobacter sp. CLO-3]OHU83335.1 hypothetical protein BKN38_05455 [Helicobacter sp. CLO-3]